MLGQGTEFPLRTRSVAPNQPAPVEVAGVHRIADATHDRLKKEF
jgi:hypothetical protein